MAGFVGGLIVAAAIAALVVFGAAWYVWVIAGLAALVLVVPAAIAGAFNNGGLY